MRDAVRLNAGSTLLLSVVVAVSSALGGPGCTSEPDGPIACEVAADCVGLIETPDCDRTFGRCSPPCDGDSRGTYACEGGVRSYCDTDPSLPCTVCPAVCGSGMRCDEVVEMCVPLSEVGEACAARGECASNSCTAAGVCGVAQGEACTEETCDGACLEDNDGNTYCVRQCTAGCASSTAGGFDWRCIMFGYETTDPSYCVPLDSCSGFGDSATACVGFTSGRCGMACPSSGGCFNFCVPDPLREDS